MFEQLRCMYVCILSYDELVIIINTYLHTVSKRAVKPVLSDHAWAKKKVVFE